MSTINARATALTRAHYQRLSAVYDLLESLPERRYHSWRKSCGRWCRVRVCWKWG